MRFADARARFNRRLVNRVTCVGETFSVVDPRIVPTRQAAAQLSTPWRQVISRMRTPSALLLRRAD